MSGRKLEFLTMVQQLVWKVNSGQSFPENVDFLKKSIDRTKKYSPKKLIRRENGPEKIVFSIPWDTFLSRIFQEKILNEILWYLSSRNV